jgi:hypothetical protein
MRRPLSRRSVFLLAYFLKEIYAKSHYAERCDFRWSMSGEYGVANLCKLSTLCIDIFSDFVLDFIGCAGWQERE